MNFLEQNDKQVYDILQKELARQNSPPRDDSLRKLYVSKRNGGGRSIFTNKYAEGYPYKRYYGGCEFADEVEQLAIDRAKKLFGYPDMQTFSPIPEVRQTEPCLALLKPYDKMLDMDLSHGGHLTHGAKVNFSGQNYESFSYGVELDGYINYDRVADIANIVKPKMIICGASAYSRDRF